MSTKIEWCKNPDGTSPLYCVRGILKVTDALELEHDYVSQCKPPTQWPLPNVALGVTAENQKAADERIPLLLQTPAVIRFVSLEPLLGPVDISHYLPMRCCSGHECGCMGMPIHPPPYIDGVIVGGESGLKARPMHPDWVRSIRDQCQEAVVPFFFKQWGEWHSGEDIRTADFDLMPQRAVALDGRSWTWAEYANERQRVDTLNMYRCGKKRAGRLLDGVEHNELHWEVKS